MRNLKRALSLTLASVMLLGMMVVGSSAAAGYDDVSETDNVEAIEVLQAIEVMVGDERGFGPERPVNRAEMAVVMGKLLNLDYNYYATSCPFDDVYDWARGYVGACAANKIVSGRGDGVYDPGATVTAVEAASMLMRALGYFQYANDVADGFELSTVRQGTIIGIFDGVGSSATEPMTRNQVAQMVLNALQSAVVEPDGNTINLTTPDGTVLTGKVNYVSVTSEKAFARAIGRVGATSIGSTNDGWIVELGERLYDGKLKLNDVTDAFGRPSRNWEYDATDIGTYVKKELIREEYTAKVSGRTLYDLLGKSILDSYDLDVYIDGVDDVSINGNVFGKERVVRTNENAVGATGKGVLTQVFVDPDEGANGLITVAVINTYLAIADEDYDDRTDDVDVTVYGIREYAVNSSKEYVKNNNNTDGVTPSTQKSGFTLELEDFASITDTKKDDVYLVTVAQGEVQTVAEPEILSGVEITSFKKGDWIVTAGTQYDLANASEYECESLWAYTGDSGNAVVNLKNITYNVYLDKYGYALGVAEVERVNNYVFITGIDTNTNNRYAVQADATGIFLDGTIADIKIDMSDLDTATRDALTVEYDGYNDQGNNMRGASGVNSWFTYTVDDNDIYDVTVVGGYADIENTTIKARAGQYWNASKADDGDHGVEEIAPGTIALRGAGVSGPWYSVYGDDNSVYITAELKRIDNARGTDVNVIGGVEDITVGIDNANIELWTRQEAINETKVNSADTGAVQTPYGVYTLFDKDGYIIGAVAIGEDSGAVTNLVYTHTTSLESETNNTTSGTRTSVKGTYTWTRKAIDANGDEILLTEVDSGVSKLNKMAPYTWYVVKYNSKGEVRSVVKASDVNGKSLIENNDIADAEDRYVYDIETLEKAMAENRTVLFEVSQNSNVPSNSNFKMVTIDPKVENHTFYVTTKTGTGVSQGFRVADDVKIVFRQCNNREWSTTLESGYNRLEQIVNRLHDRDEYTDGHVGYRYEVSALMNNYKATVVVIRDINEAGANFNGGNSNTNVSGNVTFTTRNVNGIPYVTMTYTYPEYVDENTANVDLAYEVYAGSDLIAIVDTGAEDITADGAKTHIKYWNGIATNAFANAGDVITVKLTKNMPASTKVRLLDQGNNPLAIGTLFDNTGSSVTKLNLSTGVSGGYVGFKVVSPDVGKALPWTIAGITSGNAAVTGAASGTVTTAATLGAATAAQGIYRSAGTGYVDIKVTMSDLATYYTMTGFANGSTLSALGTAHGVTIPTEAASLQLGVVPSRANAKTGEAVQFTYTAAQTIAATNGYGIKVTLTDGTEIIWKNDGAAPSAVTKTITVANSDVTVKLAKVEKLVPPTITGVTFEDVDGDGTISVNDILHLTFSAPVKSATLGTSGAVAATGGVSYSTDKTTATITITTAPTAASDAFTLTVLESNDGIKTASAGTWTIVTDSTATGLLNNSAITPTYA